MNKHFIIPKFMKVMELLPFETRPLLLYATLYADSLTDEEYDGLINEDGLKLFITPSIDHLENETGFAAYEIPNLMSKLQEKGFIKVFKQPKGKPSVIFIEPLGISVEEFLNNKPAQAPDTESDTLRVAAETTTVEDLPKYTDEEIEVFGCWQEVFGEDPPPDIKEGLSSFTGKTGADVLMLAIYESEGNAAKVLPRLKDYVELGIKSVEELQNRSIKTAEPELKLQSEQTETQKETAEPTVSAPAPAVAQEPPETKEEPKPANRTQALSAACDNEFKLSDVTELWISMQKVIDEDKWDDYTYLTQWLRTRYKEMAAQLNGGEPLTRLGTLQDLISKG